MQSSQRARQQQCFRIRQQASHSDSYTFFNASTALPWFDQVESLLPRHRERLFPPTETLSMFLNQALSADRSCQNAVIVLNAAVGPYRGKGSDEQHLLRSVLESLSPGDVLLGDAYFATYSLLCALRDKLQRT